MKTPRLLSVLAAYLLPLSALAANPIDGSWKGTFAAPDGGAQATLTFTFKVVGDAVTGNVVSENGPVPIASGTIKGDTFEFKVDLDGTPINHTCKVSGDTIAMTFTFGDQPPATMALTRVPAAAPDPSGTWAWRVAPKGTDQVFEVSATFALAGGKLTGSYHSRMGDAPISDASFNNGAIAFSVVRERDGSPFVVKYQGVVSGDSITGTLVLPGFQGGESATVDWNASRSKGSGPEASPPGKG